MYDLQLADDIVNRIRERNEGYDQRAYVFVLAALEYSQRQRTVRGHVSGKELAWACRDLAVDQFGLTARTVLDHWGLRNTGDIGRVVFVLIDIGLFRQQESDCIEDFGDVYDFDEAFDKSYPWAGVRSK